jgi:very-short-patch-repair endonuclease
MGHKCDTADARLAQIAGRQHGVVTLRQLEEVGLSRYAVAKRAQKGRLHRVHQGIYAVGHRAPNLHGRWMAAVLACGEGAVLSHGSAAALWKLLRPIDGPVHVSVPTTTGRRNRSGIHLHRTPKLAEPSSSPSSNWQGGGRGRRLMTTYRDNIPVTTVARTIDDLKGSVPPRLVRRAMRQAELAGYRLEGVERRRTRSELEEEFLRLWARHGLPAPEVNVKLGRWEVDFLWRDERLVVEIDSFAYHRGSVAFEDDHARDLDLRAAGFVVHRFTERQLSAEPGRVVEDVARALEQEDWLVKC